MKCNRCNTLQFQLTTDNVIDTSDCFVRHVSQLTGVLNKSPFNGCILEFKPNGPVLNIDTGFKPAA